MRRKLVLLVLVAAATAVPVGSGTTWAAKAINLLPMGDSITQQAYYVSPLTTLLSNNGYTPTILANEGHSGYIIQGGFPGATRTGLAENINTFMNHPGVNADNSYVLLMIGTNDVDTGCKLQSTDVPNVQTRLGGLISSITNIAPLSHLIVAQIVPITSSIAKDTAVKQFNTDVAASVATAKAAGKNVSLVDMYDAFHPNLYGPYTGTWNPYMGDNLHPNQTGGNAMAQVWLDGIRASQAPEPSTLILLGAALLGVLAYAWRKRKGEIWGELWRQSGSAALLKCTSGSASASVGLISKRLLRINRELLAGWDAAGADDWPRENAAQSSDAPFSASLPTTRWNVNPSKHWHSRWHTISAPLVSATSPEMGFHRVRGGYASAAMHSPAA